MKPGAIGLIGVFLFAVSAGAEILLSNVSMQQREGSKLVDIYYDVSSSERSEVSVFAAISNGTTAVEARSFSGDYGASVSTGVSRHMVWDGGSDLNTAITSNLSITIMLSDSFSAGMVRISSGINSVTDPDFGPDSLVVDAFLMDATEITKSTWDLVAATSSLIDVSDGSGREMNHPVQAVTWYEAVKWCNARSERDGFVPCYDLLTWSCDSSASGYRLPSAEEWEYASRGGHAEYRYPWGDEISQSNANYYSTEYDGHHPDYATGGYPYTSPAGSFQPNGFGLYDIAGNVWEWCNDSYRRGGSWDSWETDLRCGASAYKSRTFESYLLGFRAVRTLSDFVTETRFIDFDSRNYILEITSAYGFPVPAVGESVFPWRTALTCSVQDTVPVNGTNYTCIGWSGAGSVPASGNANAVTVVLNELTSSIVWVWASDDTDQDGLVDEWELAYFGTLDQGATDNFDNDVQDNVSEFISGTDPTNAFSFFQMFGAHLADDFVLSWPGVSNRTYSVYWTPNLEHILFKPLETNLVYPVHSVTTDIAGGQGFYKVDVRMGE